MLKRFLAFFVGFQFRAHDLTTGAVDYPALLKSAAARGPAVAELRECAVEGCRAWTNSRQGGICARCREQGRARVA